MNLSSFAAIVGTDNIRTDMASRRAAVTSWHPLDLKARQEGMDTDTPLPRMVLLPADTTEVSNIVRTAHQENIAVLPVGGASNYVQANRPRVPNSVALDLSRLKEISWDEESLLVTAGSGMSISELEETLNRHGYTLGVLPASANLATVGGAIATNAIGLLSGRYGRFADIVAGVEAVLPTGEIIRTPVAPDSGLPQWDTAQLFVGGEGQFGILTSATLRMRVLPEARAWAAFRFARWDDAADAVRLTYRTDARPALMRILDAAASPDAAHIEPGNACLLFCVEGDELVQTGVYQTIHAICQKLGGAELPGEIAETWYDAQTQSTRSLANARIGVIADTLAFWSRWSSLKFLKHDVVLALEPRCMEIAVSLCHADANGAALEIHWTAQTDSPSLASATVMYEEVNSAACAACLQNSGLVAHHFGLGMARAAAFAQERGNVSSALWRHITRFGTEEDA